MAKNQQERKAEREWDLCAGIVLLTFIALAWGWVDSKDWADVVVFIAGIFVTGMAVVKAGTVVANAIKGNQQ